MREPTPALAPVRSLGIVLVGCPTCRRPLGLAGAAGIEAAVAEHLRGCEPDACPRCLEEARLYWTLDGWRCGDCLGELVLDDLGPLAVLAEEPAELFPAVARVGRVGRVRRARRRHATQPPAAEIDTAGEVA
jgi:hypothetical protein